MNNEDNAVNSATEYPEVGDLVGDEYLPEGYAPEWAGDLDIADLVADVSKASVLANSLEEFIPYALPSAVGPAAGARTVAATLRALTDVLIHYAPTFTRRTEEDQGRVAMQSAEAFVMALLDNLSQIDAAFADAEEVPA